MQSTYGQKPYINNVYIIMNFQVRPDSKPREILHNVKGNKKPTNLNKGLTLTRCNLWSLKLWYINDTWCHILTSFINSIFLLCIVHNKTSTCKMLKLAYKLNISTQPWWNEDQCQPLQQTLLPYSWMQMSSKTLARYYYCQILATHRSLPTHCKVSSSLTKT